MLENQSIDSLIANGKSLSNIGLANGKMGIALYFFYLSRYKNDPFYERFALELLDDIAEAIDLNTSIDFENGITGIGWAIEHLLQNGFIEGNADDILEEIDAAVSRVLFYRENSLEIVMAIAFYYISRISYRIEDESNSVVLQLKQDTILLIDEIERLLNKGELRYELGTVLKELHKLRLYNFKVEKLQEIANVPFLDKDRFSYIPSKEGRMEFSRLPSISIIMSFCHCMDSFRVSLPHNISYFAREGVELIICLDCPDEKDELCHLVASYPELRCRIIMNSNIHQPCNHALALNVGIRSASQQNIMIIDSRIELQGDLIEKYDRALKENPDNCIIGKLLYVEKGFNSDTANWSEIEAISYGSIAVARKYMHLIGGYDETFAEWEGYDDNLRVRLWKLGIKPILLDDAIFLHQESGCKEQCRIRQERSLSIAKEYGSKIFNPPSVRVNDENWGRNFNEIIYDNI